jgi:hypothetical protein
VVHAVCIVALVDARGLRGVVIHLLLVIPSTSF